MKNTVNASVEFHYRGELYSSSVTIDLDSLMESQTTLTSFHHVLAKEANIDSYSYQYEMLLAEEVIFKDAQGIAAQHVHNGQLDVAGFELAWRENNRQEKLQSIAKNLLEIDDLEQHPALNTALQEAFNAGKEASDAGITNTPDTMPEPGF